MSRTLRVARAQRLWLRPFTSPSQLSRRFPSRLCSQAAKKRADNPMPLDAGIYWKSILDEIQSPTAQRMRDQLDMTDVTGMPKNMRKAPPCFEFHTEIKVQHPEKLVVVQVGDFYETSGHDAVLLVSECGLTAMSPGIQLPRAGFPVGNLPKMRRLIVDQRQLSLVVCNQYELASNQKNGNYTKGRRVAAVYNPGDQSYSELLQDPTPPAAASLVCLSWAADGYSVAEYKAEQMFVRVTAGMTQDALWGYLLSRCIAAPVCVHSSFSERMPDWQKRLKRVAPHVANRIRKLTGEDPMGEFFPFLKKHEGLGESVDLDAEYCTEDGLRRCPSFYTAAQLGMVGGNGIPDILDFLTPQDSLAPVKAWFKDLLLVPRTQETSQLIQEALKSLAELSDSLPDLRTYLSPGGVVKTFDAAFPPVDFLRKVHALLSDVISLFQTSSLKVFGALLLKLVEMEQRVSIDPEIFLDHCSEMKRMIEEVIVLEVAESGEELESLPNTPADAMSKLAAACEEFHGIVHDQLVSEELQGLQEAKNAVANAVFEILEKLSQLTDATYISRETKIVVDKQSESLYFQLPVALRKHPEIGSVGLIQPQWSLEKKTGSIRNCYSSVQLESAISVYKAQCLETAAKVRDTLASLGEQLSCGTVVQSCRFSIAAQSLIQHSWEAGERGWSLPELTAQSTPFKILNMWPYWMEKGHEKTVTNSVTLEDMVLLTGPNMAGKSTVLRSIAAVAMLALAGLYVPAETVQCPFLDHLVLRSFSGDNPFERHSGFSMEMAEMQLAVEHCTDRSLILIDELGKGTEVKTGGGLSGSLLEYFAEKKSLGIFSTHLHLMKKMPLKMDGISMMKMDTYVIEPDEEPETPLEKIYVPEWTVTPGYNAHSLALQVAWEHGLASHVIARASSYETELAQGGVGRLRPVTIADSTEIVAEDEEELSADVSDGEEDSAAFENNGVPFPSSNGRSIPELLLEVCQSKGVYPTVDSSSLKVLPQV